VARGRAIRACKLFEGVKPPAYGRYAVRLRIDLSRRPCCPTHTCRWAASSEASSRGWGRRGSSGRRTSRRTRTMPSSTARRRWCRTSPRLSPRAKWNTLRWGPELQARPHDAGPGSAAAQGRDGPVADPWRRDAGERCCRHAGQRRHRRLAAGEHQRIAGQRGAEQLDHVARRLDCLRCHVER